MLEVEMVGREHMVRCIHRFISQGRESREKVKPFSQVPGPHSIPIIGSLWKYFPLIGEYEMKRLDEAGRRQYERYGEIVKENLGGTHVVHLFNPDDIQTVFRLEGKFPLRKSHTALAKYRLQCPHLYNDGGLLPTNGPVWGKLRSALQKPLSGLDSVKVFLPVVDEIALEFVQRLGRLRDENGEVPSLLHEISKCALEIIGAVALETRLDCMNACGSSGETEEIIVATMESLEAVMDTELSFPLWHWINTPAYQKLCRAQDFLYRIAERHVERKEKEMKLEVSKRREKNPTLLEAYLMDPQLDRKDIITMVTDMIFAGIDTTSFSLGFILYHLAKWESVQAQAQEEVKEILKHHNSMNTITPSTLAGIPYLKAVMKESMRLVPISIGIGRILPHDTVLSGYLIPAGVVIVTGNQVICNLERYFQNAHEFRPERWLRDAEDYKKVHPFLTLPFGYGPRACIGRRLAEQNLLVLLLRILERFKLKWNHGDLGCMTKLINAPDGPLRISFSN